MQKFNSYIIRHPNDNSQAKCPKCLEEKLISNFYIHSVRGDGYLRYRPYCKSCRAKKEKTNRVRPVHQEIIKTGKQVCKSCKKEKVLDDFYANGCFSDGTKKYRSTCKICVLENAKLKNNLWYTSKCERRSASHKNFISGILNHCSKRKSHLGFDLDMMFLLDIYEKQSGFCAISGVKMTYSAGCGKVNTNISIDRIDSSKGYKKGNVQFVCDIVNRMKQELSESDLFDWCKLILKNKNEIT